MQETKLRKCSRLALSRRNRHGDRALWLQLYLAALQIFPCLSFSNQRKLIAAH